MSTQTGGLSGDTEAQTDATEGVATSRRARMAIGALGVTLLALGVRRRSLLGAGMVLLGCWLSYRSLRGSGRGEQLLDVGVISERERDESEPTSVERSITVGRPAEELYEFWRDPEKLTQVFGDVVSVTSGGENRHHWRVAGPLDRSIEWNAEIVEDHPGEFLRWESVEGALVPNAGSVGFRPAPGDRGTEVTLTLDFDPPGGQVGDTVMDTLTVVPETLAGKALRRFKSLAETGEIPTLDRNPSGRGAGDLV